VLDGEVTSYFEWLGAGQYMLDQRDGSMHGKQFVARELHYGSDGRELFLRVDFAGTGAPDGLEIQLTAKGASGRDMTARFRLSASTAQLVHYTGVEGWARAAYHTVWEAAVSLQALGLKPGAAVQVQLSLWHDGLPVDAIPSQGWLEAPTADPLDWPI
jgi:hypothetical protein